MVHEVGEDAHPVGLAPQGLGQEVGAGQETFQGSNGVIPWESKGHGLPGGPEGPLELLKVTDLL